MLLAVVSALSLVISLAVCYGTAGFASLNWLWMLPLAFLGAFLVIVGLGFGFLMILCKRVDQSVPQEDDDPFYRFVAKLIVGGALPFLRIHVKKTGLEKMPKSGRFLLVCNHCNDSDPIILFHVFSIPPFR